MPDPVVTPGTQTDTWYAGLAEPIKAHITNRGHDKEEPAVAAAKLAEAHFAAQKLIGVPPEQVVRLPKDATDPSYPDVYKRVSALGAPKEPAGYTLEGIPEATATQVRALATKLGLPVHVAAELAAGLVSDANAAAAATKAASDTAVAAMQATMRATMGANYDLNMFKLQKVGEALGWDKAMLDGLQTQVGGDKLINALLTLGDKMGEAPTLRGPVGGGPLNMTRDQAVLRKAEIMTAAQGRKFTDAELADAQKELVQLATIIMGPAPR